MLVPEMVLMAVSLVCHADVMPTPGPNRSTQDPKLEKEARTSEASDAATVIAGAHTATTQQSTAQTNAPSHNQVKSSQVKSRHHCSRALAAQRVTYVPPLTAP